LIPVAFALCARESIPDNVGRALIFLIHETRLDKRETSEKERERTGAERRTGEPLSNNAERNTWARSARRGDKRITAALCQRDPLPLHPRAEPAPCPSHLQCDITRFSAGNTAEARGRLGPITNFHYSILIWGAKAPEWWGLIAPNPTNRKYIARCGRPREISGIRRIDSPEL